MLVRRDNTGIRLFTRNGHDWTERFPLIARAALSLKAASCLIDGEAVSCDGNGFDRLRYRRDDRRVFLYAFDLIELNGDDLRDKAIETRKASLAKLLRNIERGVLLNEHISEPGDVVFRQACKLGLEGIVSKKLGSRYVSGRSEPTASGKQARTRGGLGPQEMALKGVRQALILKRASASRSSGRWKDDDFDVLANGTPVGRIFKSTSSPIGASWMWTLVFGHHEDRTPTHGYAATREDAMAAFAKSWRRE